MMNSKCFRIPQNRLRVYFVGILVSLDPVDQLSEGSEFPAWRDAWLEHLRVMETEITYPVHSFLLEDRNDSTCKQSGPSKKKQKKETEGDEAGEKWEDRHLEAFHDKTLQWPPEFDDDFAEKVANLPRREQELVRFDQKTRIGEYQSHAPMLVSELDYIHTRDVNQTLEYGKAKEQELSCILSTSRFWLRAAFWRNGTQHEVDRELLGCGALNLQGFDFKWQSGTGAHTGQKQEWTQRELMNLAGNSFTGAVVSAVLLATFAACPLSKALALHDKYQPPTEADSLARNDAASSLEIERMHSAAKTKTKVRLDPDMEPIPLRQFEIMHGMDVTDGDGDGDSSDEGDGSEEMGEEESSLSLSPCLSD